MSYETAVMQPERKENLTMKRVTLNDGNTIPAVGFGVFLIPNDGPTYDAVLSALKAGYRHIDTAAAYFNESDVGKAVRDSGIRREEIFITSKLWLQDYGYEAAKKGLETSLEKLGMDYIDLYLLHQPYGDVAGAWKALEEAKAEGKVKSIGVSNMTPKIWNEFVPQFDTVPVVNQVECNPFFQQKELRALLEKDDVKIEAYQPLGHGNTELLTNPVVTELAEKYGKNAGQVILRFEVQEGFIVLPKSENPERIAGNIEIFDFELSEEEMEKMRALDTGKGGHDPEAPGVAEMLLANYKIHD
nr:aldo/keto reductase [Mediterraneibacter glycyrrhizinilyticus]